MSFFCSQISSDSLMPASESKLCPCLWLDSAHHLGSAFVLLSHPWLPILSKMRSKIVKPYIKPCSASTCMHTHTHTPVRWPQSNLLYFSWYSFLSFFSFKTIVNVLLISKSAQNMFSLSLCISHFYPISLLIHLWGSKSHTYFKTGPMCNPSVIFELIITARVVLPWDFLFF